MRNKLNRFVATPLLALSLVAQEDKKALEEEIQKSTKDLQTQIQQAREQLEAALKEKPEEEELHVILAPKEKAVLSNQISTPILSSQVSETIKKIYKRMGESFKKGDVLIEIDDEIFVANVQKAEGVLSRAKAGLDAREKLFKDNISSYLELKEAQALAASAEAELVLARTQLDGATILAPFNGKVVAVAIEEFELPQPGQALMEVINDEVLLAKVLVPSTLFKNLSIGKIINVHIRETDTNEEARIIRIGAIIDPASGTVAIDAEVNNHDEHLRAGMTGTTTITDKSK